MFPWGQPGFDCDDFADAAAGWFHHHLEQMYPGMTIDLIGIASFPGGGHAIVRVCYAGGCVYADPQTGQTLFCPSTCSAADIAAWLDGIGCSGFHDPFMLFWTSWSPGHQQGCAEAPPSWTDGERRNQFEDVSW